MKPNENNGNTESEENYVCLVMFVCYLMFISAMAILVTPHALWLLLLGFSCKKNKNNKSEMNLE